MQEENSLNHLLKFFVKGSFIFFVGALLSKIATYLYKAIIARTFSPEIYGLFSLAVMVFSFFASFFSLGLQSGLLRYISLYRGKDEKEKIQSIVRFSLFLTLFLSVMGGALLFFSAETISLNFFHTSELTIFLQWFAFFIPISLLGGIFHVITLAYEKVGWYSFIGNILSPTMQLISLIVFILLGLKIEAIILSHNFGFFVILLSAFLVSRYSIRNLFRKPDMIEKNRQEINKKLFSYSWPIMFLGLIGTFFSGISSFVIGYFGTATEVGVYNAAVPITFFLLIAPSLFLQLFLPIITKEYSRRNFSLIKNLSKQIGKWIFILNVPLLIIMFLFPGAVINILFGADYIHAENSLRFLAIGLFFYSLFQISENLLSMIGKSRTILFNLIITTIFSVVLNSILIPVYGINGAAFSTMLSYILLGLLSFFEAKKYTSINPLNLNMLKIILISVIPTIFLFYVRSIVEINLLTILVIGISFIFVYFLLIFLTHSFDKNDLMIVKAIRGKFFKK